VIEREQLARLLVVTRKHLLSLRRPEGFWEGRLSSSALSTATAVTALALGAREADRALVRGGVCWLAGDQDRDGGWGDTPDSPSNLSTSLLATAALRLAGEAPTTPALARAQSYVARNVGDAPGAVVGAISATYGEDRTFAVPILMNCALAGMVPWDAVPGLPFELAALPRSLYPVLRLQVVSYASRPSSRWGW